MKDQQQKSNRKQQINAVDPQINELQTNQKIKWYQTRFGIILIVIVCVGILSGLGYVVYLKFFQKEGLQDSNDIGANSNIYTVENESSFVTNFLEMNAQEAKEIIFTQYGDIITEVNIIPLNAIVTADFREDRVRLFVDDANVVKKVNAPGIPEIEGSSPVQTTPTVEEIPSSSKNSNVYEVDEPSSPQISIEPYVVSDWRDVARDNNYNVSLLMDDVKIETQYKITLSGKKLPDTKIILPYNKEIENEITIDQFLQSPRLHCFKQLYDEVGVQGGYFKDINTGEKYIKKVHDKDTYLDHAFFTYRPSEFVEMINGKPTIQAELHIKEAAPTDLKFIFLALTNGPYEPGASCYQEPVTTPPVTTQPVTTLPVITPPVTTTSPNFVVEETTPVIDPKIQEALSIINSGEVYEVYCGEWGGNVDCRNGQVTGNLTACNPDCSNPSKVDIPDPDREAEQRLIKRLKQKIGHTGYKCYSTKRVDGSLSGPREMEHKTSCTTCNFCKDRCGCKGVNCGVRNDVKNQVMALLSENKITQDQADRFISNLVLENHPNCV